MRTQLRRPIQDTPPLLMVPDSGRSRVGQLGRRGANRGVAQHKAGQSHLGSGLLGPGTRLLLHRKEALRAVLRRRWATRARLGEHARLRCRRLLCCNLSSASVALALHDMIRLADLQPQTCWLARDFVSGRSGRVKTPMAIHGHRRRRREAMSCGRWAAPPPNLRRRSAASRATRLCAQRATSWRLKLYTALSSRIPRRLATDSASPRPQLRGRVEQPLQDRTGRRPASMADGSIKALALAEYGPPEVTRLAMPCRSAHRST